MQNRAPLRGPYCADFNDFCTDLKLGIPAFDPCENYIRAISISSFEKQILAIETICSFFNSKISLSYLKGIEVSKPLK